mmetsp:Transcript_38787/g.95885  ORF Transcript_38787/g.95885 Transcript_38787/m.95885 type:complete len:250 (-) Transcript_38787:698-1447(-)
MSPSSLHMYRADHQSSVCGSRRRLWFFLPDQMVTEAPGSSSNSEGKTNTRSSEWTDLIVYPPRSAGSSPAFLTATQSSLRLSCDTYGIGPCVIRLRFVRSCVGVMPSRASSRPSSMLYVFNSSSREILTSISSLNSPSFVLRSLRATSNACSSLAHLPSLSRELSARVLSSSVTRRSAIETRAWIDSLLAARSLARLSADSFAAFSSATSRVSSDSTDVKCAANCSSSARLPSSARSFATSRASCIWAS